MVLSETHTMFLMNKNEHFNHNKNSSINDHHLFFFFFCLHRRACGILVPRSGIEPTPSAIKAQSLNHWAPGEFPHSFLNLCLYFPFITFAHFSFQEEAYEIEFPESQKRSFFFKVSC